MRCLVVDDDGNDDVDDDDNDDNDVNDNDVNDNDVNDTNDDNFKNWVASCFKKLSSTFGAKKKKVLLYWISF